MRTAPGGAGVRAPAVAFSSPAGNTAGPATVRGWPCIPSARVRPRASCGKKNEDACRLYPVPYPAYPAYPAYPLSAASAIRFAAAASPGTASSSMNITWSWFSTT